MSKERGRGGGRQLNCLRIDRVYCSKTKRTQLAEKKTLVLWIGYKINECVRHRIPVTPYLQKEELFERFFKEIVEKYHFIGKEHLSYGKFEPSFERSQSKGRLQFVVRIFGVPRSHPRQNMF